MKQIEQVWQRIVEKQPNKKEGEIVNTFGRYIQALQIMRNQLRTSLEPKEVEDSEWRKQSVEHAAFIREKVLALKDAIILHFGQQSLSKIVRVGAPVYEEDYEDKYWQHGTYLLLPEGKLVFAPEEHLTEGGRYRKSVPDLTSAKEAPLQYWCYEEMLEPGIFGEAIISRLPKNLKKNLESKIRSFKSQDLH